jgi:hypothetical protein
MGGSGSGTPKAALLKLDGTQVDALGNVSKTDFFNFLELPRQQLAKLEKTMTPEQALKFRNHIVRMKVGTSAAIPMLCGGKKCPNKSCPFHDGQDYPISDPCPVEANLISTWLQSYVEDLQVDVESRTEMVLVNKLVECDIIDYRANNGLSTDEEAWNLLRLDVTEGDKATSETLNPHPILEVKDKVQKVRAQILESLAATRKEKYKRAAALKRREDGDVGQHFAYLKEAIGAMAKRKGVSIEDIKADAEKLADESIEEADWEAK